MQGRHEPIASKTVVIGLFLSICYHLSVSIFYAVLFFRPLLGQGLIPVQADQVVVTAADSEQVFSSV